MEFNVCPLCRCKVQDWQLASGKALVVKRWDIALLRIPVIAHHACVIDFKMSNGRDYEYTEE